MAEADKDGRAAQIVGDLMATTAMSISETIIEAREGAIEAAEAAGRLIERLHEAEEERAHWEAEHAALFHAVAGDGAAARFAKAFGGYDDLAWARLDAYERQWLTNKGQRVVDMIVEMTS